jgi:hypothetical protein
MKYGVKKLTIFISLFVFSISVFSLGETPKKRNFSLAEHSETSVYKEKHRTECINIIDTDRMPSPNYPVTYPEKYPNSGVTFDPILLQEGQVQKGRNFVFLFVVIFTQFH